MSRCTSCSIIYKVLGPIELISFEYLADLEKPTDIHIQQTEIIKSPFFGLPRNFASLSPEEQHAIYVKTGVRHHNQLILNGANDIVLIDIIAAIKYRNDLRIRNDARNSLLEQYESQFTGLRRDLITTVSIDFSAVPYLIGRGYQELDY